MPTTSIRLYVNVCELQYQPIIMEIMSPVSINIECAANSESSQTACIQWNKHSKYFTETQAWFLFSQFFFAT